MELQDPVPVFMAESATEGNLVAHALTEAGIEAFVTEDHSAGVLFGEGVPADAQLPLVWVEQANEGKAKAFLVEYMRRAKAVTADQVMKADVEVVCDECDVPTVYPAEQNGSVQECPSCGAWVDVGEMELPEGFDEAEGEEEGIPEDEV